MNAPEPPPLSPPPKPLTEASLEGLDAQLRNLLAQGGPLSAKQLVAATGKSQPSISLALGRLGSVVHRLGAARSSRYTLTRSILGLPSAQNLLRTNAKGRTEIFGTLQFLQQGEVHVRGTQGHEWLGRGGLPWFLSSLRPQGFLGRQYTHLRPDFPSDPDAWTTEQALYMAANHISDPPGAFALGAGHSQHEGLQVDADNIARFYDHMATQAGHSLPAASSAGGGQPKFTARVQDQHVIVKFSPLCGTPFGERWHNLLQLEHLANQVLQANGIASAPTVLLRSKQRTYLQSTRFDRIGTQGKRHVVELSALHDAFVQTPRQHWVASCEALVQQKLLSPQGLERIALQYLFGQYIGNTDMHFGNLAFFVDDVTKPQLEPTPVYDMLPMQWRPGVHSGELGCAPVQAQRQPAGYGALAERARHIATLYWQQAAQLRSLSSALRAAARSNAQLLARNFQD